MYELYENIEMPLVFVLYDMEKEGIRADGDKLKEYSRELAVSINKIEKRIYEEAGEEFNINSPKQLGVVLFEKLQLPNEKKTKPVTQHRQRCLINWHLIILLSQMF